MTRVVALLLALVLGGCGSLMSEHVATGVFRPPHQAEVELVPLDEPVPYGFVEIGIVRALGTGRHAQPDTVREALRQEARRLGATMVVRVRLDRDEAGVAAIGVAGELLRR